MVSTPLCITALYNGTLVKSTLTGIGNDFIALKNRKAFYYWYLYEGMEECEFDEALNDFQSLMQDYEIPPTSACCCEIQQSACESQVRRSKSSRRQGSKSKCKSEPRQASCQHDNSLQTPSSDGGFSDVSRGSVPSQGVAEPCSSSSDQRTKGQRQPTACCDNGKQNQKPRGLPQDCRQNECDFKGRPSSRSQNKAGGMRTPDVTVTNRYVCMSTGAVEYLRRDDPSDKNFNADTSATDLFE
ncbi:Tubulin beta chain [Taenia solium]|eukprot:TsM_000764700 transcript=TsM_000764700 gene=TsM_000764700